MAPLWVEIMDYITPVINGGSIPSESDDNDNQQQQRQHIKFALYSGHDSTIIPLMASLSPKVWNTTNFPYYASMMIIEVRRRMGHLFR
jgi:hypothetical protein